MSFSFNVVFGPEPQSQSVNLGPECQRSWCEDEENDKEVEQSTGALLTLAVILQETINISNLIIQFSCIIYILNRRFLKKSTFFTILFILSLTVSFRVIFYIISLTITAFSSNKLPAKLSLYVDYCTNFFSLTITFLMSLNRCFCFVSNFWNEILFDRKHVALPIIFSALISISGAVLCIITSEINRIFLPGTGFIDIGVEKKGFKVLINRLFFVFPFGSIACYIILFHSLRKQNQLVLKRTSNRNKAEHKVFVQLLVTTVLYGIMSILYETFNFIEWADTSLQLTFISIFIILNYLPEMSLPLLLICSSVQIRKTISTWIAPKTERTVVTERVRTATTNDN